MDTQPDFTGMSVRSEHGVGCVRFVRGGVAVTEFASGTYPLPLTRLQAHPQPEVLGSLVAQALTTYKRLRLRLERAEVFSSGQTEEYLAAMVILGVAESTDDAYAADQRRIRAAQPKRSPQEAHAQARRVLAAALQQQLDLVPV